MSERGGEFWAFLTGAVLGGVIALLYAPAKGSETREKIRRVAEDAYAKGGEIVESGRTEADKVISRGREKLEKFAQKCEEKAVE
jgi:gas vesicle protein